MVNADSKFSHPDTPDLMVLGEIICKHWMYAQLRYTNKSGYLNFIPAVEKSFYEAPVAKFNDTYAEFKTLISRDGLMYNDTLMFVMAVIADLVTPEAYFKKLLTEFKTIVNYYPVKESLDIRLDHRDYTGCVLFALRFFIDQIDLIVPMETKKGAK